MIQVVVHRIHCEAQAEVQLVYHKANHHRYHQIFHRSQRGPAMMHTEGQLLLQTLEPADTIAKVN